MLSFTVQIKRLLSILRRPIPGAGLVAGVVTCLLLLDHFVVRPLQVTGLLDRVASVYIKT